MEENVQNTHTPGAVPPADTATPAVTIPPAEVSAATATPAPPVSLKDADDATKLKTYNEMFNTSYKTLAEAFPPAKPSKEEQEAAKEAKRKNALSWGIENGKLTPEQIEKAVLAKNKSSRDIAKELFAQELREEDVKISDEDIELRFQDYAHEDLDENDPLRKAALKRIEKTVQAYRATATQEYDGVEGEYDRAETTRERFGNYSTQVKALAKDLPKELTFSLPYKSIDGSELSFDVSFPIDDKTIEAVRKDFLNEGTYRAIGAHENDVKPEALQTEMQGAIYSRVFKEAVTHVAAQMIAHVEKDMQAKLKAVPATGQSRFVPQPQVTGTKEAPKHTEFTRTMNKLHPQTAQ